MEHAFLITLLYILTLFSFVPFILFLVILFPLYILLLVLLPILRLSVITSLFLRIRVELLCTIIIAIIIVCFISYCVRTAMTCILATKYIQQRKIPIQNNKTLETVEFVTNYLDGAVAITVEGSILRTCLEWVASDPKL